MAPGPQRLTAADIGRPLGPRATLVQFSSAFCAPCRATRVLLADVAGRTDGVASVDIDAESHLDLVRALGVLARRPCSCSARTAPSRPGPAASPAGPMCWARWRPCCAARGGITRARITHARKFLFIRSGNTDSDTAPGPA